MKLSQLISLIANLCLLNTIECIINGEKVNDINKFKYQIGITSVRNGIETYCGGGILNNDMILTAAHCFAPVNATRILNYQKITVRAHAKWNRVGVQRSIVRQVRRIYVPVSFFGNRLADIAIIQLKKSLKLEKNADKLQPLQLPPKNIVIKDQEAVVAGYGANKFKNEQPQSDHRLRYLDVKVVSNNDWRSKYARRFDNTIFACEPSDFIQGHPKGVCYGDSGTPVIAESGEAIGVLKTNGLDCDDTKKPAVYVKISDYLDTFINKVLDNPDIDDSSIAVEDVSTSASCFIG